jgi:hypothetical protein
MRSGQAAAPAELFGVCASQANLPTVYFSGVLQGPVTAFQGFRTAFTAFLVQQFAYQGIVTCAPTNSALNAMTFIARQSTALRNAKKTVIDTGWSEPAVAALGAAAPPPAAKLQGAPAAGAAASPTAGGPGTAGAGANGAGGSAAGGAGASQWASLLGSIFGGGSTGAGAAGAKSGTPGKTGGTGGASGGDPMSNALTNVFGSKSSSGAAPADPASKNSQQGLPDGALGAAQWQTTKLVVYGCGRQDRQVACVTELTNQHQQDTLVHAADVWKDAFIVDDRGDRHQRATGFFLNVDGDQRPQIDISYGKTARFVLLFDDVQSRVQKVALRSATGGLDVEEIHLIDPGAAAPTH